MSGNMQNPRGTSVQDILRQAAFRLGAKDYREGRGLREGDDLPELDGLPDNIRNRQRIYETGRLVAVYARLKRQPINAATVRAAAAERYVP